MTSDDVITEAKAFAARIAKRMTTNPESQDDCDKAAFLAYLQGFKAGLAHEQQTIQSLKAVGHD